MSVMGVGMFHCCPILPRKLSCVYFTVVLPDVLLALVFVDRFVGSDLVDRDSGVVTNWGVVASVWYVCTGEVVVCYWSDVPSVELSLVHGIDCDWLDWLSGILGSLDVSVSGETLVCSTRYVASDWGGFGVEMPSLESGRCDPVCDSTWYSLDTGW